MREQALLLEHGELVADRSTARTSTSGSAASAFEPTGWPVAAKPSITFASSSSWRGVSTLRILGGDPRPSGSGLGRRGDDPRVALARLGVDQRRRRRATSRTVEVTTISCSGTPIPRNWTDEARSALGPAGRLGLRARDLGHRPQPVQDPAGQADRAANSSSMWIGLKSPDAPA